IYANRYWNEECFGLTGIFNHTPLFLVTQSLLAETLVVKAMELKYMGGVVGPNIQPTPFLCLLLKLLQLSPGTDVIMEYIENEEYRYVTLLGLLYLRLTESSVVVYQVLERFYTDYRKFNYRD